MRRFQGVYNLTVDLRPSKQEVRIRLREGALGRGVDAQLIAAQLRAALQGTVTDEIQVGPEAYEVTVQFPRTDRDGLSDLEAFYVTLGDGTQAPLDTVAEWEICGGWSRIARIDGLRTVTLRRDTDPREINTAELFRVLETEWMPRIRERYPEVRIDFQGEVAEGQTTQQSMWRSMMIGVIGVYILLSFQFRSYSEPLIVMMAIPLASIGVVFGHWLVGADLSTPSMLGFVSLAGIVVNDSILLVLFLKRELARGRPIHEAAAQASRQRFRAIVLTSVTTAAGLLPLLAEKSLQAQVLIPLAISIVFGLMASTVLVLAVIPCSYHVFEDLDLLKRAKPSPPGI